MPKFRLKQNVDLKPVLQALGLHDLFVPPGSDGGADLAGISDPPSPSDRLYVTCIQHAAFVDVNERGTEAAAVTVMAAGKAEEQRMVPFVPEFRADRPFLFLIRDNRSGAILFMGRLVQPQAAE